MERKITGYGDTVTTIEEDGKFFVMKTYGEGSARGARRTYTYVEVDKDEYMGRLQRIANAISQSPSVKVTDIIVDALQDYPLEKIERIESDINGEIAQSKKEQRRPAIKTKAGRCCEIQIGRRCAFVVRD